MCPDNIFEQIRAYALAVAGTDEDLDTELEAAALEDLGQELP